MCVSVRTVVSGGSDPARFNAWKRVKNYTRMGEDVNGGSGVETRAAWEAEMRWMVLVLVLVCEGQRKKEERGGGRKRKRKREGRRRTYNAIRCAWVGVV
jgi:hypothetical protein